MRNKNKDLVNAVLLFGVVSVVVLTVSYFYFRSKATQDMAISSFEECAAAGYPVMESYPGQCRTRSGKLFVQDIGNELELSDQIVINKPRPNEMVQSPLTLDGRAVGPWFFEASFSVNLVDENNALISSAVLTADEEWMTTKFVPFSGRLIFDKPATKKGKLIFSKANPSGDPERDVTLVVPVFFQ